MINGRIWNEIYADPVSASQFLSLASQRIDERLSIGVKRRLRPVKGMRIEQAKEYLDLLCEQVQNLHIIIKVHYAHGFEAWMEQTALHPLQKIIWQKHINLLKEDV